ncbi:MAG: CRISPR-associated endonuclease Cas1 [Anaerolineales bacterium]|nr:CRISPR-associated endonuclease Cas1 [Anaerolineales bacterium]
MPVIQHLIVDGFGLHVGKHSGRLQVMRIGDGTPSERLVQEAPLLHLESVVVTSQGISMSADAVQACCLIGIPIYFLDSRGRPYAALYSAGLTGTVLTRREQLLAAADRRGLDLAIAFATGKITNQAGFIRYVAKYREEAAPDVYEELRLCADEVRDHLNELDHLEGDRVDQVRFQLLSVEGRAAQKYWDALKHVIPERYGWPGRKGRESRDPLNAALNYGYGILYGQIERALVLAGLDPYGGFIHADRPGKPSLVFDLIEEFRQVIVDRTVVGMANKGMALELDDKGRLVEKTRRDIAEKVLDRLEAAERYEQKRQPLRVIIQSQARHIATFVRGDRPAYVPFVARW